MGINDRIIEFLKIKGISKYRFYKETGFSNGFLDKNANIGSDKCETILYRYPEINAEWLVTGRGKMLKPAVTVEREEETNRAGSGVTTFLTRTDKPIDLQRVPLYDIEAVAGLVPLFSQQNNPVDHLSIPNLPKCDGAVFVRGDSMYPLLKSGDIVLYKQIHDFTHIIWGEMYLISFDFDGDEFITVKYLNRVDGAPDRILLVSYNQHHAPKEIPIECVRAMALVKASVRFNTM